MRLETILLVLVSSTIKKSWMVTVGWGRSARSRVQAAIHALGSGAPHLSFYHLTLERVFPDNVYADMLTSMPLSSDYRPMSGRAKGNDMADGTHTRVKIDLFPEYIRGLPPEKRAVWDVVGAALCSNAVRDAFVRQLAPGL